MKPILIGCEESQTITKAFRAKGYEAYSCDLEPCTGGHPEWHIQHNLLDVIRDDCWGMMIAHPPCTYLAVSGVQWLSHPDDKHLPFEARRPHPKYPNRRKDMREALRFFKELYLAPIPRVCIENPVGLVNTWWRKPTQIIQPYQFGDSASKKTCLWLQNLPTLEHTNVVDPGERRVYKSGKSHPKWWADIKDSAKTDKERRALRSKTFEGIANAIVDQWGPLLSDT